MNKRLAEAAVCATIMMIVAPLVTGCGPSLPPSIERLNVVSAEDFNSVSNGDSYDQVTETLGAEGKVVDSRNPLEGVNVPGTISRAAADDGAVYAWRNSAGDVFLVAVEEGEVIATAEVPRTTE